MLPKKSSNTSNKMPAKSSVATVSAHNPLAGLAWIVAGLALLLGLGFFRAEDYLYFGSQRLIIEKVSTPDKIVRGLSGRNYLPRDRAMLFVFKSARKHCFWMKDMKFSIDILWLDNERKLVHQARNIKPDTFPAS